MVVIDFIKVGKYLVFFSFELLGKLFKEIYIGIWCKWN